MAKHFKVFGLVILIIGLALISMGAYSAAAQTFTVVNSYTGTSISSGYVTYPTSSGTFSPNLVISSSGYPINYLGGQISGGLIFYASYNYQRGLSYTASGSYCVGSGCTPSTALPGGFSTTTYTATELGKSVTVGQLYNNNGFSISMGTIYNFSFKVCDSQGTCSTTTTSVENIQAANIPFIAYANYGGNSVPIGCLAQTTGQVWSCPALSSSISLESTTALSFTVDVSPSYSSFVQSISITCAISSGGICPWSSNTFTQSSTNSSVWTMSVGALPVGGYTLTATLAATQNGGVSNTFLFGLSFGGSGQCAFGCGSTNELLEFVFGIPMTLFGAVIVSGKNRRLR